MSLAEVPAWEAREEDVQASRVELAKVIASGTGLRRVYNFEFPLLNKIARRARDRELIGLTLDRNAQEAHAGRRKKVLLAALVPCALLAFFVGKSLIGSGESHSGSARASGGKVGLLLSRVREGYPRHVIVPRKVWIANGAELKDVEGAVESPEMAFKRNFQRVNLPKPGEPFTAEHELVLQSMGQGALYLPVKTGAAPMAPVTGAAPIDPALARQQAFFERAIGKRGANGTSVGKTSTVFLGSAQLSPEDRAALLGNWHPPEEGGASPAWKSVFQSLPADGAGLPVPAAELAAKVAAPPVDKKAAYQVLPPGTAGAAEKIALEAGVEPPRVPASRPAYAPMSAAPVAAQGVELGEFPDLQQRR